MLDIKTVKLKTEEEIIASWKDKEKIVVSVVCATFNHELYIEDAIIGFLMQETDFAFEVIIHDDASTDKTADIVREYQRKYPKIIKPIYQTENQYSKGGFKPGVYAASFAKGEYIALCEGDDYWCSKSKLHKQFLILAHNPLINLCVHAHNALSQDFSYTKKYLTVKNRSVVSVNKFIIGDGGYVATSSLFIKKIVIDELPLWFFEDAPVGDYYIQILSSYPNGAVYIDELMSVYRKDAVNNWSSIHLSNFKKKATLRKKILEANLLCEKELNDISLKYSFTESNYKHFKLYFKAMLAVEGIKSLQYSLLLFQLRFIQHIAKMSIKVLCKNIFKKS
jgi:glycosyltransferase involved in cell wall biosynthesis